VRPGICTERRVRMCKKARGFRPGPRVVARDVWRHPSYLKRPSIVLRPRQQPREARTGTPTRESQSGSQQWARRPSARCIVDGERTLGGGGGRGGAVRRRGRRSGGGKHGSGEGGRGTHARHQEAKIGTRDGTGTRYPRERRRRDPAMYSASFMARMSGRTQVAVEALT